MDTSSLGIPFQLSYTEEETRTYHCRWIPFAGYSGVGVMEVLRVTIGSGSREPDPLEIERAYDLVGLGSVVTSPDGLTFRPSLILCGQEPKNLPIIVRIMAQLHRLEHHLEGRATIAILSCNATYMVLRVISCFDEHEVKRAINSAAEGVLHRLYPDGPIPCRHTIAVTNGHDYTVVFELLGV